jgi:hypothetical protein
MRNIQVLIIFLFSIGVSAQNVTEINSDLKLTDSLKYSTEIRIYQGGGISNYSCLFRMYRLKHKKWITEFYEHYSNVNGVNELRIKKRNVRSENNMEFVYLNLLRSNILNLPSQKEIRWKLSGRDSIQKIKRKRKGKEIVEYDSYRSTISILDGVNYKVQIRDLNRENDFTYSNPESYLKEYPNIDELIYMSEILDIIRFEFKIW